MAKNQDDAFFGFLDRERMELAILQADAAQYPFMQTLLLLEIRSLLVTLTRETMKQG